MCFFLEITLNFFLFLLNFFISFIFSKLISFNRWNDKHSSHFSTAKEISAKAASKKAHFSKSPILKIFSRKFLSFFEFRSIEKQEGDVWRSSIKVQVQKILAAKFLRELQRIKFLKFYSTFPISCQSQRKDLLVVLRKQYFLQNWLGVHTCQMIQSF